ncbi:hypothetical protein G6011_04850 [Alternaria panax]|uniref:Uncharacterized protein n=1 Tax=Alternaria panax TaxID=48097 RepID=A0AAD4NVA3_9PLEO|nr:hypothetical protein G6011_04850 [Alternaria panax]
MTVDTTTVLNLSTTTTYHQTNTTTQRDMASETPFDSRKFDWADDDDDDFDLDSWNATADTSAPTAAELGPLQVPPNEDATKEEEEETYTLSRIRNERANWDSDAATESFDAELAQEPELITQLPAEYWYLAVLNCRPEHQVMSARFDRITRAIGLRYDGKEQAEASAYPELSSSKAHRSSYAKGFQKWKMEHRSLSCSKVYRNSPLNIVTSIENAHEIDDKDDGADEEEHEVLDEYEAMQMFTFEQQEQAQVFGSDDSERDQEADREMNEEIERMLVDQSRNNINISERFSRKEIEDLYYQYKAGQLEAARSNIEEVYANVGLDVIEEEDVASIDSRGAGSWDEQLFEPYYPCPEDQEVRSSITGPMEKDDILSSIVHRPDDAVTEEELDFNDIVFGNEDDGHDFKSETKSEIDSEPSDEGYASSSPPITLTLEIFRTMGERHMRGGFIPAEMRLSSSSMRRRINVRFGSIDALKAFRQTARNEQPVDDVFEEYEHDDVLESIQKGINSKHEFKEPPGASKGPEFALIIVPPEEEDEAKACPLSDLALILVEEAKSFESARDDDRVPSIDHEGRGILDRSFAFPGPSADSTLSANKGTSTTNTTTTAQIPASKPSSRRWTDPPKYIPGPSSALPALATRHKKQGSLCLDHLASAVTKSRFYISEVPWTQFGIMTAGVVAGGLLSMTHRY